MKHMKLFESMIKKCERAYKNKIDYKLLNFIQDCCIKYEDEGFTFEISVCVAEVKDNMRWDNIKTVYYYSKNMFGNGFRYLTDVNKCYKENGFYYLVRPYIQGPSFFHRIADQAREREKIVEICSDIFNRINKKYKAVRINQDNNYDSVLWFRLVP